MIIEKNSDKEIRYNGTDISHMGDNFSNVSSIPHYERPAKLPLATRLNDHIQRLNQKRTNGFIFDANNITISDMGDDTVEVRNNDLSAYAKEYGGQIVLSTTLEGLKPRSQGCRIDDAIRTLVQMVQPKTDIDKDLTV